MSDSKRRWMTADELVRSHEKRIDLLDAELAALRRIHQEAVARLTALEERIQCGVAPSPAAKEVLHEA